MSSKHCFFAKCCDEVRCDTESNWVCLTEIKDKSVNKSCFPGAKTFLEVMLLKADLFYQHTFDLDTAFVCSFHYKVLLEASYVRSHSKCDVCECLKGSDSKNKGDLRIINVSQAITLLEIFNCKHSYGKLICSRCRNELEKSKDPMREELHNSAFACLFEGESFCCMEVEDADYQPRLASLDDDDDEMLKKQREALNNFLDAFGSNKKILRTDSYKELSYRMKLRYINLTKFILASTVSFMAKQDAEILSRDAYKKLNDDEPNIKLDGKFCQVLSGISEAYTNAETRQSRREILSIVAPKVSLNILRLFIPDLTEYRFFTARFHARPYSMGARGDEKVVPGERFDRAQVAHFVDYIISPNVCIDLAFGERTLKLSCGTELYVPKTIRNMGPTRIVDQYLSFCKSTVKDFTPLSRSSLFRILDACKASTRQSLQGIDYFAAEASEGFDGIQRMIESSVLDSEESKRLVENLKRARAYLKSDYKVHVARSSNVADHCCSYALSDPNNKNFDQTCNHEHNEYCQECSNIVRTLDEIEYLSKTSETNNELLDRCLNRFRTYRESIEAWKAHLLRCYNQDLCREILLDNLSDDEVYINLDWAMKFLPVKSREPQSEFFGKRGISWHITVVMKKRSDEGTSNNHFDQNNDVPDNVLQFDDSDITDIFEKIGNNDSDPIKAINKLFEYKVFVHVFDECAQDSEITLTILKDVLGRVKNSNPEITKAFIRADNAGCYHSADTLVSVIHMSKLTGIAIKRFDFCDPQGGKGACDRYAAVIKSHVRRYLNENHNVTNATEFVEACHLYKGVKGVLALNCKIVKDNSKKNKKCTIKQITNYYNFEYRADGLLVHRSWNVGPGLLIYWSRLNLDYRILDIVSNQIEGFLHNWVHTEEKNESDMMDIDDCTTDESEISPRGYEGKALFECDVREGCTAAFMKFGNLMNHILRGRHNPKPERFSLKDTAMKLYHCKLEEVGNRRMISIDIQEKQINHAETRPLSKGWALPIRKPHKEFSAKQREYLKAKFNEGVSGVKHWKPRDVVADMENLRVNNMFYFSASEILTENQIRSFFGRMNRERQTVGSTENIGRRMDIYDNSAQNVNEKNDEEETDLDLQILEEFQDMEAAVEETLAVENAFSIAQETLEACVT